MRVEGIDDVVDEGEGVAPDRSVESDRGTWVEIPVGTWVGLRRSSADEGDVKAAVAGVVERVLELKEFGTLDEFALFGSGDGKDAIFIDVARTAGFDFDENEIAVWV